MKIIASSVLDDFKTEAETKINQHFDNLAGRDKWRNLSHAIKRVTAQAVIAGADAPQDFADAAAMEGLNVEEFAALVVSKANELMQKENERRRLILAVRNAQSGTQLTAAIESLSQ